MKDFYQKIIEEEIIKPQIERRQAGWLSPEELCKILWAQAFWLDMELGKLITELTEKLVKALHVSGTPWDKDLAYINCSFDLNEEGHETEDLDKLSHLYKKKIKIF